MPIAGVRSHHVGSGAQACSPLSAGLEEHRLVWAPPAQVLTQASQRSYCALLRHENSDRQQGPQLKPSTASISNLSIRNNNKAVKSSR